MPDQAQYSDLHQSVLAWTSAIKAALAPHGYAAETFERVANYPSRWGTPNFSRHFWTQYGTSSFGLETPYALVGDLVLTRERYREAGARIAHGVVSRLLD